MEIITLTAMALSLASPFINKIGEGTARKIGEDIWNLMKKPFSKKGKNIEKLNEDEISSQLKQILSEDPNFKKELEDFIINAQSQLSTVSQNIQNNGSIEKQVNIGNNIGNIHL
ncbi:hypothetical protein LIV57_18010 [Chryseobacterium sp. X308]|uniref:hypothetical protein n=1 Tax=Chryseobacterium sp. X308 TaxID=2884873 RepID=UPI001D158229|nr:hypothetical protein [Chryseobacterium sp. X308]MCC3217167.1 hypothetical protein [Chryseobacterium sp. X308]